MWKRPRAHSSTWSAAAGSGKLLAHAWPLHQGAFPWHLTAGCVPVGYSHDGSFLYLAVPQAVMDGNWSYFCFLGKCWHRVVSLLVLVLEVIVCWATLDMRCWGCMGSQLCKYFVTMLGLGHAHVANTRCLRQLWQEGPPWTGKEPMYPFKKARMPSHCKKQCRFLLDEAWRDVFLHSGLR